MQVRSLRMAPDVIRDVLEGVLLLMGQEDTSWAAMRAFLGKRSIKDDIVTYDAHRCGGADVGGQRLPTRTRGRWVSLRETFTEDAC